MDNNIGNEISVMQTIQDLNRQAEQLHFEKLRVIEKGLKSDDPRSIVEANKAFMEIAPKIEDNSKSYFIDPLEFNANLGFKDKSYSLSYMTLKRMSKTPIISSIIKTRKNQVADFAEPQNDKYSNGFVIRKKGITSESDMTREDKRTISKMTDFILSCGMIGAWDTDDFDTFIRKLVDDSLTYDQMTFEVVRNRRGIPEKFLATDGSTYRISDTKFQNEYASKGINLGYNKSQFIETHMNLPRYKNYLPTHVQIYNNSVVNEFYPWELCFGVRNPSTSIYQNGYGLSELEELINVVTSMLWGDEYNRRFFSQGSAPKGLLRVKGNPNEKALQQFKQQWQAMITGVMQSWKTPVVEADIDWIDLQKNNRDMEYNSWMEYLIKIACAIYSIDPTEIGWDISKSGGGGLFDGGQEERMQHSKDKGLYPLLKFIQRKLNKYIIEPLNPEYELVFVGINGMSLEKELELDIKKVGAFTTINETRKKYALEPIENGDVIENAIYYQSVQAQKQQQQQEMMNQQQGEENPFDAAMANENPFDAYADSQDEEANKAENNLFVKAFDNFMKEEGIY